MTGIAQAGDKRGRKTAVSNVTRLSHVALKTKNAEAQAGFYEQMVGLKETGRDDRGYIYLGTNERHHSVVLVPSEDAGGVDHFALELGGGAAGVEAAADAISKAGIEYEESKGTLGQGPSLRMRDPNGLAVELISGVDEVDPNYGPRAVKPRQQDHVSLKVTDPKETAEFYEEVLGFRVSDRLSDHSFYWLRCNPYHHSLGLIKNDEKQGLHHLSFEVVDFAELGHQAEHLMRNGHQLLWGPGRHGPGNNQFEYFRDLDNNIIEFTCDALQIWDPDYKPRVWDPDELWINLWGPMPPDDFTETP